MEDIESIVFENNYEDTTIDVKNKKIVYDKLDFPMKEEVLFAYLKNLFKVIDGWNEEYIDTSVIDGGFWEIRITYKNNVIKKYYGKAAYPNNFDELIRINRKLYKEVFHNE